MAEKVILETQVVEGFTYNNNLGFYAQGASGWFDLEAGKTYRVVWDGETFTRNAYQETLQGHDCVFLGNEAYMKGESQDITDPFLIYRVLANGYCCMASLDTKTSHEVGIYEVASSGGNDHPDENEVGVVLQDYNDETRTYTDVEVVRVPSTTEGEMVHYVREDLIPEPVEKTVKLDFSGGGMEVLPELGKVFSKLLIPVPDGLASANIADGVTVAGIPGSHKGGGAVRAGSYWETEGLGSVSKYNQIWFDCGNERYAFSLGYTGSGNDGTIYKYVDGAWAAVTTASISAFVAGETTRAIAMDGGKTYIFRSENNGQNWYVFDGTNFKKGSHTLPGKIISWCIHNGIIAAYFSDVGSIYSYSESSGWELRAKISAKTYEYFYIESVNDELYAIKSDVVYKVADGGLTEVGTTYRFSRLLAVEGNCIIYLAQTGYSIPDMIRSYNVVENADILLGYGMGVSYGYMDARNFSDRHARCLVLKDGKGTHNVFSHVLHIIE